MATAPFNSRQPKPPPPGFAESFIRWGWRGVETIFGSRTACNVRWVEECGGEDLKGRRLMYRAKLREMRNDAA